MCSARIIGNLPASMNFLEPGASEEKHWFAILSFMKKLLFLATLITSLAAVSPQVLAKDKKDKDKDKDRDRHEDYDKKRWKETRDDVRELREQYSRLSETARREDISGRLRDQIGYIGMDVRRISDQFERDSYDARDLRDRINRAEDSINRARQQVEYERSRSNSRGRYYRPF